MGRLLNVRFGMAAGRVRLAIYGSHCYQGCRVTDGHCKARAFNDGRSSALWPSPETTPPSSCGHDASRRRYPGCRQDLLSPKRPQIRSQQFKTVISFSSARLHAASFGFLMECLVGRLHALRNVSSCLLFFLLSRRTLLSTELLKSTTARQQDTCTIVHVH